MLVCEVETVSSDCNLVDIMVKGERYMRFLGSGMTRTPPWTGHKIQWIANATQRLYLPLNMIGVV